MADTHHGQQMTYLALLSSPDLSWCGVAPLIPRRLANLAADLTERKVIANLNALRAEPGRLLVIDEDTAEVGVRSYVRHDDLIKQPNVTKAMIRSLPRVRSKHIRDTIVTELRRKYGEDPDLKGWATIQSAMAGTVHKGQRQGIGERFMKGQPEGSAEGFHEGMANYLSPLTSHLSPCTQRRLPPSLRSVAFVTAEADKVPTYGPTQDR